MIRPPAATQVALPSIRRSALLGLLAQVGPGLAILVASPLLYGALGAAKFGVLSIVLLTPQLALAIDFGLLQSSVRRYAGLLHTRPADVAATFAAYSVGLAVAGVFLAISLWLAAPALSRQLGFDEAIGEAEARRLIVSCAVWAALALATSAPWALARGAQRFEIVAAVQTLATVGLWAGAALIVMLGQPMRLVVALGTAITLLAALAYLLAMRADLTLHGPLREGWRLLWADRGFFAGSFQIQVASVIVYHLDRVLVALFASPAAAGIYALCVNLANKLLFGISSMIGFVFPRASSLAASGQDDALRNVIRVTTRAVLCLVLPTLAPALLLAGPFFRAWIGDGFESSMEHVFQVLWSGFAVSAVTAPATLAWLGARGTRLAALFAWISAATLVALLALLAPGRAELGAAWAAFAALATSALFFGYVLRALRLEGTLVTPRIAVGYLLGVAAQSLVLLVTSSAATGLAGLATVAAVSFGAFFVVRQLTRTLTPEEIAALAWAEGRWRKGST